MDRRIVRRGLAVLTLALGLVLGGAQPAAAEETGFRGLTLDRLLGLLETGSFGGLWESLGSWFTVKEDSGQGQVDSDRGFGIDPNGAALDATALPPEPAAPEG